MSIQTAEQSQDTYRGYSLSEDFLDFSLTFGIYPINPSVSSPPEVGEMSIEWHLIGPELKVFDDGWQALAAMPDVIAGLAALGTRSTQEQVLDLLVSLGFEPYR